MRRHPCFEAAVDLAERDRQREPVRELRVERDLRGRHRSQIGLLHALNGLIDLACPRCRGRVFVPVDSDRERVDCDGCGEALVTHQDIGGVSLREQGIGGVP